MADIIVRKTQPIRCYGGTLHGRLIHWDGYHNYRCTSRNYRRERWNPREDDRPSADPMHKIDTYRIDWYNTERGDGFKRIPIMVLEGRPLFPEEEWQMHEDSILVPWQPKRPPRFLTEFERWYAWKMYEITGEYRHIEEYMR